MQIPEVIRVATKTLYGFWAVYKHLSLSLSLCLCAALELNISVLEVKTCNYIYILIYNKHRFLEEDNKAFAISFISETRTVVVIIIIIFISVWQARYYG
jgi:hypothetical protein